MNWKYFKIAIALVLLLLVLIPTYRYFSSIDWTNKHTAKIAALPILSQTDNTGSFRLRVRDFEFLVRVAGLQNDGPAAILLHGFPESSIMWEDLLGKAAAAGYRVVAFDQRGYSPGARPLGVSNYELDHLTADVMAVANEVGFDRFHLVGHDWGAVVGWNVVMEQEERVETWTALSIPHIGVFFDAVQNHTEQKERSGYFKILQLPILPEYKFIANHQDYFKKSMASSRENYLAEYLSLQAEWGACTAMLNWYRAMDVPKIVANKKYERVVKRPSLFIWGKEDRVIAPEIIPQQKAWIDAPYKELALATGHGIIQTKPDTVIQEILAHFKQGKL